MRLENIDWPTALESLRAQMPRGPRQRQLFIEASSLAAYGAVDLLAGLERLDEAQALDPFNPLHIWRRALLFLRFGDFERARGEVDRLAPLAHTPWLSYLKTLILLRSPNGLQRAKGGASTLEAQFSQFAPGQFLRAEVELKKSPKGVERILADLPAPANAPALWADVLAKVALTGPDGTRTCERWVQQLDAGSPERRALQWLCERIDEAPSVTPADWAQGADGVSMDGPRARRTRGKAARWRRQALASVIWARRRENAQAEGRAKVASGLLQREPTAANRTLGVTLLTRQAAAAAEAGHYPEALRLVEVCQRLEPHELVHQRNRAALFTLMREETGYFDAWAEVDALSFRMLLVGRADAATLRDVAKTHRMFAQQARMTSEDPNTSRRLCLGIFREEEQLRGGPALVVNQARIDADPEQLRQWIHHRRAELIFEHLALGATPERFLLAPSDMRAAQARLDALIQSAESLRVLVTEEGSRLEQRLGACWAASAANASLTWAASAADTPPDAQALEREHLQTFADLALLALSYNPSAKRSDLVDELLSFLTTEAAFFDGRGLATALLGTPQAGARAGVYKPSRSVQLLASTVRLVLRLPQEGDLPVLAWSEQQSVLGYLRGRLLTRTAIALFNAAHGDGDVSRALAYLDRARHASTGDAWVEVISARLFALSQHFEESERAIARFHEISGEQPDPEDQSSIEQSIALLRKARKDSKKARQREKFATQAPDGDPARREELAQRVIDTPSAIHAYEELAHELAIEGAFRDALATADEAIAHCLSRDAQMRARALHLELTGLAEIAQDQIGTVRLYLAGARGAVAEALAKQADPPYAVGYIVGLCHVALKQRDRAEAVFVRAAERCPRALHRSVLTQLAADVERALIEWTRQAAQQALDDGVPAQAAAEIAGTLTELRAPEAMFIDIAQVQLSLAMAGALPGVQAPWPTPSAGSRHWAILREIEREADASTRARRMAGLAIESHPASARAAERLLRKISIWEKDEVVRRALVKSGHWARQRKWAEALAEIDAVEPLTSSPLQLARERVLLLLRLERFEQADLAVAALEGSADSRARPLVRDYPALRFTQAIQRAQRLIRAGDGDAADGELSRLAAHDAGSQLELAYCRAFCAAQRAGQRRSTGLASEADGLLRQALGALEEIGPVARARADARFDDLRDRLEKALEELARPS